MRKTKVQRVAMAATGLALVTSLGLSTVSIASAAAPAAKIKQGAAWTLRPPVLGLCFNVTFNTTTHRFTSSNGGAIDPGNAKGTWSGGGSTISMEWTKGNVVGMGFSGTFTTTPLRSYQGEIFNNGQPYTVGELDKGYTRGC